ncbi:leucine-rich repeat protein [Metamycoplasma hominis]|uniref:leucine-rich repeat protein n=1 Tax=Metamycoplasma hominis TaxID=2098 RepID=UPI001C3E1433|nr:leucine-rich repeat domain-containing protein [Metamycoplasma hominis]
MQTLYTNIKSITIPGSVKEIGERAFSDCTNLEELILNEGLEKIGESAFFGCWNLKKVIYKGDASNINRWLNIGIDKTKVKIISSNN